MPSSISRCMPRSSSRLRTAGAELVGGGLAHGGEAPVLDELAVAEGAEVGLGVADVDDEEHGRGRLDSRTPWPRPSTPSPPRTRARRSRRRSSSRASSTAASTSRRSPTSSVQRALFGRADRARARARRREGHRLARDHAQRSTSACPSRRCCRPTRRSASRSGSPSSGATRCCSRSCAARSGSRCGARPRRCRPTARARGCRSPTSSRALTAPLVARAEQRINDASELNVRADLRALDQHLARIERWMDHDVVGGEQPNAADLQIGSGLALLLTIEDVERGRVAPRLRARAAVVPGLPGARAGGRATGGVVRLAAGGLSGAPRRRPVSASAARMPSGSVTSGSSSSSGTSTNRRAVTCACGSVSRSDTNATSPSSSTSTSIGRGPCRTPPGLAPEHALDRLARVEQRLRTEVGLDPHAPR